MLLLNIKTIIHVFINLYKNIKYRNIALRELVLNRLIKFLFIFLI